MRKPPKAFFIDVDHLSHSGHGDSTPGSVFLSRVPKDKKRVICALADGKGPGVKARVTAELCATMAVRLAETGMGMDQIAELLLQSPEQTFIEQLEYPSFSLIIMQTNGTVRMLEFGLPPVSLFRNGTLQRIDRKPAIIFSDSDKIVFHSKIDCATNDRFLIYTRSFVHLFRTVKNINSDIENTLAGSPEISSRELIGTAYRNTGSMFAAKEGLTIASMYLRRARKLIISTGAPYNKEKDAELAGTIETFEGKKVICGGTTARIIGRELKRKVTLDTTTARDNVPPVMDMDGIDLITEGTLTLGRVIQILERGPGSEFRAVNAAERLVKLLLDSDVVRFLVGTRINEVHQDPSLPAELETRRSVVRRISDLLENTYLKEVEITFL